MKYICYVKRWEHTPSLFNCTESITDQGPVIKEYGLIIWLILYEIKNSSAFWQILCYNAFYSLSTKCYSVTVIICSGWPFHPLFSMSRLSFLQRSLWGLKQNYTITELADYIMLDSDVHLCQKIPASLICLSVL